MHAASSDVALNIATGTGQKRDMPRVRALNPWVTMIAAHFRIGSFHRSPSDAVGGLFAAWIVPMRGMSGRWLRTKAGKSALLV